MKFSPFSNNLVRSIRSRRSVSDRKRRQRRLHVESLEARRVFAGLLINEVVVDTPGTDTPYEYVEIKGIPGSTLSNVYFVSIEGDSASQGLADVVVDLSGQTIGSNGLLVIKADGAGFTIPAETTVVIGPESFNTGGGALENGSNSFALIRSPSAIVPASDLDPENDGQLNLPVGSELIDALGWVDGGAGDVAYGAILTQQLGVPAGAATRFLHDNRALQVAAWYSGDLVGTNPNVNYTSVATNRSSNFPEGGSLTPGGVNVPGDANLPPEAVADTYAVEPGATLTVSAGAGVLANDTDPNGVHSILWATVDGSNPANAVSFVFLPDGSFTYVNDGTPGTVSFAYRATDLNLFSAVTTVTIDVVVSTNTGPVITVPSGPSNFQEGDAPLLVAVGASLVDNDSPNFASGTLTVEISGNAEASDVLQVRNQGSGVGEIGLTGNVVQFGGTTIGTLEGGQGTLPLVVSLNSNATASAVQALMSNITYQSLSDNPGVSDRTLRFQVNDGDGGPTGGLSNAALTTVTVAAVNDAPGINATKSNLFYAAGDSAVTVDGLLGLVDPDSADLDQGVFTATLGSGVAGDSLTIRNVGSGAGQVGVNGTVVSYGGIAVGTLVEGTDTLPLTVTFNASSTLPAVHAVMRSLVFATTSPLVLPPPRSLQLGLTDGDGGTATNVVYTLRQSSVRMFAFQQGVDNGQGTYNGVADIQLSESQPDTPLPEGALPATEGLLVDFDGGTANSQVLLRFDSLFGSEPGKIPSGATIVSARLVLFTKNGGDGATLHRMLTPWEADTETWNSFGNGVAPRNALPAVQADDVEAKSVFDAQIGVTNGNSDPAANPTLIGVTMDLQAWSNGEANHGWLMKGWDGRSDGWAFAASESPDLSQRPRLEVQWMPNSTATTAFRQGENGYTGTVDTALTQLTPDQSNGGGTGMLVDFSDANNTNTSQVLLRFDDIIGNVAGRIPAGSLIHAASLDLASTVSNAQGDGGNFHAMLQTWSGDSTWNSFGEGVAADNVESASQANLMVGSPTLNPNAEAGFNTFSVTQDVQRWVSGESVNHGWAVLPWNLGTDGWIIESSESAAAKNRPQLRVFFTPIGVTAMPVTSLVTSESGSSVEIQFRLATPPMANVTIPLSSSDTSEGTINVNALTFTPLNWEIPQSIVVTGVNDAEVDGDVSYSIVVGPVTSSDSNYNGLDPSDITLINEDETFSNQPPQLTVQSNSVSGVEGSTITQSGTWSDPNVGDVVTLAASVGTIVKNADGTWQWSIAGNDDLASTTVTVSASDGKGGSASVEFTYSVTNAAPVLTRSQANATGNVLASLTNQGTWSDVAGDTVTLTASLGNVVKNADGTWNWSYTATGAIDNSTVTITGTDEEGGSSVVTFTIDALVAVVNSQVYYKGSTFAGSSVGDALDPSKSLAKSGGTAQTLSFANVINSSKGINGLVFDVAGLASSNLTASDITFRMSPQGAFNEAANPPSAWPAALPPSLIDVTAGNASTPSRVRIEWVDNQIQNRWLQIKIAANANTGLRESQVYYVGHLLGETTGTLSSGSYLVQIADINLIRPEVGTSAVVSSVVDITKNGLIQISDITAMRAAVGQGQLRNITIPPAGSGGEGEGGLGGNSSMQQAPLPEASTPTSPSQVRIEPRLAQHRYDVLPWDVVTAVVPMSNSVSMPRQDASGASFVSPRLKSRDATGDSVDLDTPLDLESIDAAFASM